MVILICQIAPFLVNIFKSWFATNSSEMDLKMVKFSNSPTTFGHFCSAKLEPHFGNEQHKEHQDLELNQGNARLTALWCVDTNHFFSIFNKRLVSKRIIGYLVTLTHEFKPQESLSLSFSLSSNVFSRSLLLQLKESKSSELKFNSI